MSVATIRDGIVRPDIRTSDLTRRSGRNYRVFCFISVAAFVNLEVYSEPAARRVQASWLQYRLRTCADHRTSWYYSCHDLRTPVHPSPRHADSFGNRP
jgi:hypothetical protein